MYLPERLEENRAWVLGKLDRLLERWDWLSNQARRDTVFTIRQSMDRKINPRLGGELPPAWATENPPPSLLTSATAIIELSIEKFGREILRVIREEFEKASK